MLVKAEKQIASKNKKANVIWFLLQFANLKMLA